jgi:hypothetical protein
MGDQVTDQEAGRRRKPRQRRLTTPCNPGGGKAARGRRRRSIAAALGETRRIWSQLHRIATSMRKVSCRTRMRLMLHCNYSARRIGLSSSNKNKKRETPWMSAHEWR